MSLVSDAEPITVSCAFSIFSASSFGDAFGLFLRISAAMSSFKDFTALSSLAYLPPKLTSPEISVVVFVMSTSGAFSGSTSGFFSSAAWLQIMPSSAERAPGGRLRHLCAAFRYSANCLASAKFASRSACGSSESCASNSHRPPLPLLLT